MHDIDQCNPQNSELRFLANRIINNPQNWELRFLANRIINYLQNWELWFLTNFLNSIQTELFIIIETQNCDSLEAKLLLIFRTQNCTIANRIITNRQNWLLITYLCSEFRSVKKCRFKWQSFNTTIQNSLKTHI